MEKLNRYGPIVAFWLAVLVGSFVNFYATNLVLSDISNLQAFLRMVNSHTAIFTSIIFNIFLIAIIGTLYISRLCLRPNSRKSLTKLYLIIQIAVSFLGIVTSILSLLKSKKIDNNISMSGEITLNGKILPISS